MGQKRRACVRYRVRYLAPMASIKRRPDSPFWVACFTLPNGQRKQVSTHTEDEHEALLKANIYEKTSLLAKKKRLDESTTRRVMRQIELAAGHDGAGEVMRLRDYLKEQRELLATQHKGRTLERYQYALDHLRDDSGQGDQALHEFTPARAVEWKERLMAEGLAPATINHQLSTLRRGWTAAVQKEWVDRNPWADLRIAGAKKKRQKRQPFTFAMFEQLLAATVATKCPLEHAAEWHLLILLGGYTGQRRTDCVQLAGSAVDLKRGVVRFWRSKNKDFKEVPIHASLRPELMKAVQKRGQGKLLPALAALPPTGRKSVTDVFRQQVLPLIGIVQPYEKHTGDEVRRARTLAPYSFHSLRHALSTWLNAAGVSDRDRMEIVGHTDAGVSQGYTHAGLRQAKRALRKIPKTRRVKG
jgi:integrase